MSYAILRVAKLKTTGNIKASAEHNFRERNTPNANPKLTKLNQHLGPKNSIDLMNAIESKLGEQKHLRKNGVRVIEYMITTSPEYNGDFTKYFQNSLNWLKKRHGVENVILASVHKDETTPHLCAYVIPVDPETGRLNAKRFLGGRNVLSQMQTDFYNECANGLGLERGIIGSKAKHQRVKRGYNAMNTEINELPKLPDSFLTAIPLTAANAEKQRIEKQRDELWEVVSTKANQLDLMRQQIKEIRYDNLRMSKIVLESKEAQKGISKLIKSAFTPAQICALMGISEHEIRPGKDIFDTLIRLKKASSFSDAVTLVSHKVTEKKEWSEERKPEKPVMPTPSRTVEKPAVKRVASVSGPTM